MFLCHVALLSKSMTEPELRKLRRLLRGLPNIFPKDQTSLYRRLPTPQTKARGPSPVPSTRAMNPSLKANSPPKPISPLPMKARVEASRSRVGPYAKKIKPKVITNADDDAEAEKIKLFFSKMREVLSENLLESKCMSGSEALLILSEMNAENNGGIQATESDEVPQTEEAVPSASGTFKVCNQIRDESKATAVDDAAEEGTEDEISNSDFEFASETNSEKSTLTSDKAKYLKAFSKIAAPTGVQSAKLSSLMSRFKTCVPNPFEAYVIELEAARERAKNANDSLRIIRGQMNAASGDAPQGFVIPDLPTENLSPEVQTSDVEDSIVKALETENLRLKELLQKKSEENNSQELKLHELRCETKLLEHRVSILKDRNEDLKSTLKEERQTKSIMAELEKANQQLKKEVQGIFSLEKKKTSEINHLNIKLHCEETKREVSQQSKETDQLKSEIDALNAKMKTLESKLEEKNRQNENKQKEVNEVIKILSTELAKKVDAVTVLVRNLTQEQKYSTELKRQLEELEKERNENSQKVIQHSKMLCENNDKQTKYLQQQNEIGKLLCEICSAIWYEMNNESSNNVKNGFEGDGEEFFNKIKNDVQKLINEKNEQVEKQEHLNANMTEEKQKLIEAIMDFANATNFRTI